MNELFWKNKNVLVTGHEGFLGSNLTKKLLEYGANITGLDIKVNRKNTVFTKDDYRRIRTIKGSVSNLKLVKNIISKYKIEIIFHLAAEALVGECNKNPLKAFSSNITGTWNILEACRQTNYVEAIIVASSDKAYGSHKILPYKENTPLKGDHPYDASKSCADLIAYTYYHTYNLPISVTRCGNIYGPGDFNFSRIVPDAVRCAINGSTLMIRSDGKFTRDYVFVDDIVNGYIMVAEQLRKKNLSGEAFNFSDENPISVTNLLKVIFKIAGKDANYKILNQARYEIKHQYLCSKKAREVLKWKPENKLIDGLKKTIDWYNRSFKENN